MNPGKIIDAYPRDFSLRLGAGYDPWKPATHFAFSRDQGSFARAALRCVGVGVCRRTEGGTMCPSFMVTREEKHSTRGRAHLLFEMLQGDVVRDGWRSEAVKDALDLCLSCKGCKTDCPVNVDMATYKAEFLSHYYAGRARPRQAYVFGFIDRWARLAEWAPWLVNTASHVPGLATLIKRAAGIAGERRLPRFASQTFRAWWRDRPRRGGGTPVLLWADTFNDHFHPATARVAVEVLEAAGYRVIVPDGALCCGRPLYDYGMLDQARARLRHVVDVLRPALRDDIAIVCLEPSCLAVFRDELLEMLPHDEDARKLHDRAVLLGELLARRGMPETWPRMDGHVLLHGHCHQKALAGMGDEEKILTGVGLDVETLEAGCCGMAGGFGFEQDKYEVSRAIGERVLLPAVRRAAISTLIVADGFSCREQIAQLTNRRALHLADVLALSLRGAGTAEADARAQAHVKRPTASIVAVGAVMLAMAVAAKARPAKRPLDTR